MQTLERQKDQYKAKHESCTEVVGLCARVFRGMYGELEAVTHVFRKEVLALRWESGDAISLTQSLQEPCTDKFSACVTTETEKNG